MKKLELTLYQIKILQYIVSGYEYKEIAHIFNISDVSIRALVLRVKVKNNIKSSFSLMYKLGLTGQLKNPEEEKTLDL